MPLLGPDAKIDINGIPYGAVSGTWELKRDEADSTTTESTSKELATSPHRQLMCSLVAQREEDLDYHIAPLNVHGQDGFRLTLWLEGRGDPNRTIEIPVFKAPSLSGDFQVQNGAAQGITIQGKSSGDFLMPGEV